MSTIPSEPRSELVSIKEACRRLGVGESTLYRGLEADQVPGGRRVGERWIIARAVFERWLVDGIEPSTEPKRNSFIVDMTARKAAS